MYKRQLLHSRAPLEEVFETYSNTDSDFLMIEMHDAMETCADDTMAVQRTAPVSYTHLTCVTPPKSRMLSHVVHYMSSPGKVLRVASN